MCHCKALLDMGYSYGCVDVAWCVCVLVYWVCPAKMDELIEMPSEGSDLRRTKDRVLDLGIYWRHLVNVIIQYMLGGDAGCGYHYCNNLFTLHYKYQRISRRIQAQNVWHYPRQLRIRARGEYWVALPPKLFNFGSMHSLQKLLNSYIYFIILLRHKSAIGLLLWKWN